MRIGAVQAVLAALLLAAPANAAPPLTCTSCDRPDLPDEFMGSHVLFVDPVDVSTAHLEGYSLVAYRYNEVDPFTAYGFRLMYGSHTQGLLYETLIWWELFEPDKTQRSPKKSSLSQSNHVAMGFYQLSASVGTYEYTYAAQPAAGCKGSFSRDPVKFERAWKIDCGRLDELLDQLDITDFYPRQGISRALGIPLTKKLKIQGKD